MTDQPADEATTDLTAVLAAHFPQVVGPSLLLCKCRTRTFLHEEWLAHLADALAPVIRAERAAALVDAAVAMPDVRDLTENGIRLSGPVDWLTDRAEAERRGEPA